jgi:hypothetical protein
VPLSASKTDGKGDGEYGKQGGGDRISNRREDRGAAISCFGKERQVEIGVLRGVVYGCNDDGLEGPSGIYELRDGRVGPSCTPR